MNEEIGVRGLDQVQSSTSKYDILFNLVHLMK